MGWWGDLGTDSLLEDIAYLPSGLEERSPPHVKTRWRIITEEYGANTICVNRLPETKGNRHICFVAEQTRPHGRSLQERHLQRLPPHIPPDPVLASSHGSRIRAHVMGHREVKSSQDSLLEVDTDVYAETTT